MERPTTSALDTAPGSVGTTRPAEVAPELGPALRVLLLAIAALLRRGLRRGRAWRAALLSRAPEAGAATWWALRRGVDHSALLIGAAGAVAARLGRATPRLRARSPFRLIHPRVRAAVLGLLLTITLGVVGVGAFLGYCAYTLPLSGGLAVQPVPAAIVLEDGNGNAFATRGVFRGEPVRADQLPPNLVHAVIAIEDRRFYEHPGIDLWGIARAALRDFQSGTAREGASTITQQLVRLTYLSSERSIRRKV